MTFADSAFEACCLRASELGRRLNADEWKATVQAVFDAFSKPAKKAPVKRTTKEIDEIWIAELEANPGYAGIDIRRELGKCQAWSSLRGLTVSRRRLVAWLNKAQSDARSVAINGAGQTSFAQPQAQGLPEPQGWRDWVRENSHDPTNADKQWSDLDRTAQQYIRSQLNAA